jgi:simple sugar transport system permease protein
MIAGRGIARLSTNSVKIDIFNTPSRSWATVIFVPFSLFVVIAVFLGSWLLLHGPPSASSWSRSASAPERACMQASRSASDVRVRVLRALCRDAGLVAVSSIRTSDANVIGLYTELDAILAVVIGGTVLGVGGRFSLLGSVLGALVIQATMTSMYHLGVPASAITVVKAIVVVFVIILYSEQARDFIRRARPGRTRKQS